MFSVIIIIIIAAIGGYYYFSKAKPYANFLNDGNKAMATEQYDKAVTLYEQALSYKKSTDANKRIDIAKLLKKSKKIYDLASVQMTKKEYLSAINSFKKVDKQDTKRYSIAQSKINESKKLYITDNLNGATDNLANGKIDEANKYLDNIFKLDSNNADAIKLKADIAKSIQKKKDDIAAKAKAEKEASKLLTVDQAMNILKTHKSNSKIFTYNKYSYSYTPDDSYVNSRVFSNAATIKNNYYIFTVSDEDDDWDSNLCVDKKTGEIYAADPMGGFITLNEHDARAERINEDNK